MAKAIFDADAPYAPALAAVRALAPAPAPGKGAGSEAQALVTHILARLEQLAADHPSGGAVPAGEADELRGQIERVVELVAPLDGPSGRLDDPVRVANAQVRAWVEDAFRLAAGHLSL